MDAVLALIAAALKSAVTFDDITTLTAARICVYGGEFAHARTLLRNVAGTAEICDLLAAIPNRDRAAVDYMTR
jgi:hypothetical protein